MFDCVWIFLRESFHINWKSCLCCLLGTEVSVLLRWCGGAARACSVYLDMLSVVCWTVTTLKRRHMVHSNRQMQMTTHGPAGTNAHSSDHNQSMLFHTAGVNKHQSSHFPYRIEYTLCLWKNVYYCFLLHKKEEKISKQGEKRWQAVIIMPTHTHVHPELHQNGEMLKLGVALAVH